jgi:hypothetical protein
MPADQPATAALTFVCDECTDYWTCNVRFAMGIPVYDNYEGWPEPTRVCRGLTPVFFRTCFRCAMPRGWEQKRPGKTAKPTWRACRENEWCAQWRAEQELQ